MAERILFKGQLLSIINKKTVLPNGYAVNLEMIRHPGAALIIPFLAKDKLILLRQFRPVIDSYIYELPAGTLAAGESPLSCAKREIIEETGYSGGKFTRLGEIYPVPGYSTEKIVIFKAEKLKKESGVKFEKDEVIEMRVVTRRDIKRLFKSGKFIDAKTISSLALCGWL